jgi:3-oxoacyl-[acyl-carrier protein] reductase
MDLGLKGKNAWVLGASSGLGRASARSLAAEGANLAISARGEENLRATADEIAETNGTKCIPVPLDVSDLDAIAAAAAKVDDELGPLDILVFNAGGPPPGTLDSFEGHDTLDQAFKLVTASAWHMTQAVVPGMKQRGSGVLLYVTSWSSKEPIPGLLLSNMLRAAVVGMAKTISKELGPHGIRVACIAPGRIETQRLQELDELNAQGSGKTVDEVRAASHAEIPLRRYGQPHELGDVVTFLASDRASYLSGITVLVDGGMLHGLLS